MSTMEGKGIEQKLYSKRRGGEGRKLLEKIKLKENISKALLASHLMRTHNVKWDPVGVLAMQKANRKVERGESISRALLSSHEKS